jgi:hypothetical protein
MQDHLARGDSANVEQVLHLRPEVIEPACADVAGLSHVGIVSDEPGQGGCGTGNRRQGGPHPIAQDGQKLVLGSIGRLGLASTTLTLDEERPSGALGLTMAYREPHHQDGHGGEDEEADHVRQHY